MRKKPIKASFTIGDGVTSRWPFGRGESFDF
jgi:hypothetical protein